MASGLHRIDDILCVGPAARDRYRARRRSSSASRLRKPLGNDGGMGELDTGGLGCAVEVAGRVRV
jgi:hypothetical protein